MPINLSFWERSQGRSDTFLPQSIECLDMSGKQDRTGFANIGRQQLMHIHVNHLPDWPSMQESCSLSPNTRHLESQLPTSPLSLCYSVWVTLVTLGGFFKAEGSPEQIDKPGSLPQLCPLWLSYSLSSFFSSRSLLGFPNFESQRDINTCLLRWDKASDY